MGDGNDINIGDFLRKIAQAHPPIPEDVEREWYRAFKDGDDTVPNKMALHHAAYVRQVLRGYGNLGEALQQELAQECFASLVNTARTYWDINKGRFLAIAAQNIKWTVCQYLLINANPIKLPTTNTVRIAWRAILTVMREHHDLYRINQVQFFARVREVAVGELTLTDDLIQMVFDVVCSNCITEVSGDGDETESIFNVLPTNDDAVGSVIKTRTHALHEWINSPDFMSAVNMDERERLIYQHRIMEEDDQQATLGELAAKFNVSAERVRQIEKRLYDKIKVTVHNVVGEYIL